MKHLVKTLRLVYGEKALRWSDPYQVPTSYFSRARTSLGSVYTISGVSNGFSLIYYHPGRRRGEIIQRADHPGDLEDFANGHHRVQQLRALPPKGSEADRDRPRRRLGR